MKTIKRFEALCKLLANGDKCIVASFYEKDGTLRCFLGNVDILASIASKELAYVPIARGLVVVHEHGGGIRRLNLNTLSMLAMEGQAYWVKD